MAISIDYAEELSGPALRCLRCRLPLGVLPSRVYRRGLRLGKTVSVSLDEFLCRACFEVLPGDERHEWLELNGGLED
ncbi:MAG: hypothetical protein ACYC8T_12060 [Myxococcaceae bacterium]